MLESLLDLDMCCDAHHWSTPWLHGWGTGTRQSSCDFKAMYCPLIDFVRVLQVRHASIRVKNQVYATWCIHSCRIWVCECIIDIIYRDMQ